MYYFWPLTIILIPSRIFNNIFFIYLVLIPLSCIALKKPRTSRIDWFAKLSAALHRCICYIHPIVIVEVLLDGIK